MVAVKPNKVSPRLNVQLQVHVLSPRPAPPRPRPTQGDLGSLEPLEPGPCWPSAAALSRSSLLIKWSSPPVHLQDCARYNYNYRHGGAPATHYYLDDMLPQQICTIALHYFYYLLQLKLSEKPFFTHNRYLSLYISFLPETSTQPVSANAQLIQ